MRTGRSCARRGGRLPGSRKVTERKQSELCRLRTKWLGVYYIALADDVWNARRYHDLTTILTAHTAAGLEGEIQAGYARAALS